VKLSIIIVNWKVRELLRGCLRSVFEQTRLPSGSWEVIVVDNDSRDGSVEMVRSEFPQARLIVSETNLGFADGCQAGYEVSSGEFVLLLNPDTIVLDHAIEKMIEQIEQDPKVAVLGSRLLNTDGSFQRASGGAYPKLTNLAWNYLLLNRLLPSRWAPESLFLEGDPQGIREIEWVSGASLMFRRSAVGERIFDPAFFMFGEDMDLCDRVRDAGWKVLYSARQSIVHHHGSSFAKQSEREVLATVYKGPRSFFARTHNRFELLLYDLILFVGYLSRWLASTLIAAVSGNSDHRDQAHFSRQFVRSMVSARTQTQSRGEQRST
jgi:GT2 family glycosyltransferase